MSPEVNSKTLRKLRRSEKNIPDLYPSPEPWQPAVHKFVGHLLFKNCKDKYIIHSPRLLLPEHTFITVL